MQIDHHWYVSWELSLLDTAGHQRHVSNLLSVGHTAYCDDRPIFKLKRWQLSELLFRPREISHDKSAAALPKLFAFNEPAVVS